MLLAHVPESRNYKSTEETLPARQLGRVLHTRENGQTPKKLSIKKMFALKRLQVQAVKAVDKPFVK